MMTGYQRYYIGANLSLAMAALFKTSTFLLLRYYADNVLGNPEYKKLLPWVAVGFIAIAAMEGSFTYVSGRLAAFTAENVTCACVTALIIQRLGFAMPA
jgi:ATP-binding cassette subfamily B protein